MTKRSYGAAVFHIPLNIARSLGIPNQIKIYSCNNWLGARAGGMPRSKSANSRYRARVCMRASNARAQMHGYVAPAAAAPARGGAMRWRRLLKPRASAWTVACPSRQPAVLDLVAMISNTRSDPEIRQ